MGVGRWVAATVAAGVGTYLYGALFETRKLVVENPQIPLGDFPSFGPVRIGVLADLHVRDQWSVQFTHRAIDLVLAGRPQLIVLPGDLIAYHKPGALAMLEDALAPLVDAPIPVYATTGNHDFFAGDAGALEPILERCNVRLLRNEAVSVAGLSLVGIESALYGDHRADLALEAADWSQPVVVLWHESDAVEWLPQGADLMIAGHSHGGQFATPWGWAPARPKLGRKYVRGFYPVAPTPLYVSRGVATTGPPSRLFCPPEVTLIDLVGSHSAGSPLATSSRLGTL